MSYGQRFIRVLLVAGTLLCAFAVDATTLARLQFYQLVQHSSAIARVRCVRADVRMEDGEIWTDTVFEVMQHDKGYLPSPIVVRLPGGKYDHLISHVDGAPEFHPGEEVYIFLMGQVGKPFHIVGWSQGTFRIHRNSRTGVETVTQDSADVPVFDPQTNKFTKAGVKGLRMDHFLERLSTEIRRQAF